jgi:hypothetical protein
MNGARCDLKTDDSAIDTASVVKYTDNAPKNWPFEGLSGAMDENML